MVRITVCYSSRPITVQAGLRVRKLALHSNRSYCYGPYISPAFVTRRHKGASWRVLTTESRADVVDTTSSMPTEFKTRQGVRLGRHSKRMVRYAGRTFRSRAALMNTSPHVSPEGEMITPRFESTKDFAKKRNNLVYFRLSKILCGFKDQVRARPSGETCGLGPSPDSVILVRNAG